MRAHYFEAGHRGRIGPYRASRLVESKHACTEPLAGYCKTRDIWNEDTIEVRKTSLPMGLVLFSGRYVAVADCLRRPIPFMPLLPSGPGGASCTPCPTSKPPAEYSSGPHVAPCASRPVVSSIRTSARFSSVPAVREQRRLAVALARQPSFGIGCRTMRLVRAPLTAKIHRGIAPAFARPRVPWLILGARTFQPSPGLDQRSVHGEVIVRSVPLNQRRGHDAREKLLHQPVPFEPLAAVRERHRVPHQCDKLQEGEHDLSQRHLFL